MTKTRQTEKSYSTMSTKNETPLWLELRKEYIDDNFEQLLAYMRESSTKPQKDIFYQTTIKLLHERVAELTQKLGAKPLFEAPDETDVTIFNVRLLATFLLASPDDAVARQAYVAMMGELQKLAPKFSDKIIKTTIERLKHQSIQNIGFSWGDIIDFKEEIFTYLAISNCSFNTKLLKPLTYEKYGTACLNAHGLFLTSENKANAIKLLSAGANSLDTGVGVSVRTVSGEKLKQSDASSLPAMDDFVTNMVYDLWKAQKKDTPSHKLQYIDGDDVTVRITNIECNTIHVETVDRTHEKLSGTIHFGKPNFIYYAAALFPKYLQPGDYLQATVKDTEKRRFDIEKHFINFVTEDCREMYGTEELHVRLAFKHQKSLVWINERGTHLYSKFSDDFQIGDYATLQITEYRGGNEYGKILTHIGGAYEPDDEETIDIEDVKKDCIVGFALATEVPHNIMEEETSQELSPVVLRLIARQFFDYQKTLLKPSERYTFLANARIMSEIADDELAASYVKFASSYLRILVQFVSNEPVGKISLEPEPEYRDAHDTLVRLAVVQLLKEYGRKDNSEILAQAIRDYEEKIPILARIARLVQTANSMQGTLSDASINVIRREIIKTLSLETENDTDLEDGGNYLGVESGTTEFKTSFVYPSDNNMQPDVTAQEKNVFRGICAFLNSTTGGTLYLGVNDQGYVSGIDNDMKYLRMNSIDTYIRHIQDRAKHYFDIDGIVHLRIEPLYDNRVIAIHVEPHPYRVVELNDVAYLRVNAESREMPEKVRQELIARKVFRDKNKAAAISQLQHAMSKKLCVVLHNYASSNSGSVRDRLVEAYEVLPDDDIIMCYELSTTSDNKLKVFKISRIGWVEIKDDEPWKFPLSHKKINVDAFHMTGDNPIKVSLELDLLAKNLLVEEFPRTKDDLTQNRGNDNQWYYNASVYNIAGIARFYLGLAEHIKILNAPELKAYIQEYKERYL